MLKDQPNRPLPDLRRISRQFVHDSILSNNGVSGNPGAVQGERLARFDVKPDLIVSSPARRALTTAEIIAKKLDYKLRNIVMDDRLYAVDADDLLDVIRKLGDKSKRVMLFGHNPELTELAHRLSSKITRMPTCAVAEFTFDAKAWAKIGDDKPTKATLDYPKRS